MPLVTGHFCFKTNPSSARASRLTVYVIVVVSQLSNGQGAEGQAILVAKKKKKNAETTTGVGRATP